ncbi:MAG: DUF6427 family protein [Prevotellaceae bacterium]|jgi:hypothetical protein|nr:DUF6427 family protein [Prevotellaceae bacterium]
MVDYFRSNWIVATFFTTIFLCLLWAPDFAGYNQIRVSFLLPCMGTHFNDTFINSTLDMLITIVLAFINGILLSLLSVRYLSLGKANIMIPFLYLLTIFSFPQARSFSSSFAAALFVLLGLLSLFSAGKVKRPTTTLFMSSFFVGCACLLHSSAFIAIAGFVVISILLHLLSGRNFLVFLGGLLFTFGGCLLFRFLLGYDSGSVIWGIFSGIDNIHFQFLPRTPATLFLTLVLLYLSGKTIIRWLFHSFGNKSYRYRVLASLVVFLLICAIPIFLYANIVFSYLPIIALPLSILLAFNFSDERVTKQTKVEFAVLIIAVVVNQVAFFLQ